MVSVEIFLRCSLAPAVAQCTGSAIRDPRRGGAVPAMEISQALYGYSGKPRVGKPIPVPELCKRFPHRGYGIPHRGGGVVLRKNVSMKLYILLGSVNSPPCLPWLAHGGFIQLSKNEITMELDIVENSTSVMPGK